MSLIQTPATKRIFDFKFHQKTYLNKIGLLPVVIANPNDDLPQHLDYCMFLPTSKRPEEKFRRVISEENPAENENN